MRFKLMLVTSLAIVAMAPAAAQSVQQRFEAATARLDAKDAAGALADFEKLEAELVARAKPSPQSLALVRARKGEALSELGRHAEAIAAYRAAVSSGALDAPAVAPVRDRTLLLLAKLEEASLDHAAASATYQRFAELSADPQTRAFALTGAARAIMFADGAAALSLSDRAVTSMQSLPDFPKEEQAIVLGTRGRVLLNAGRAEEALDLLERAVSLRGGMTLRVDLWDLALRSDAALAALRLGKEDHARRFLAYSGAGRTESQLRPPADFSLPDCAELGDFTPQDSVIVQFAILDDGRVVGAQPVLASRPGPAAVEFARLVGRWTWKPEKAKEIDPFLRLATRVELRCTNSRSRPPVTAEAMTAFKSWLAAAGAPLPDDDGRSDAERAPEQRARLDAARAGGQAQKRVAALWLLAHNATTPRDSARAMVDEALSVLPPDAPGAARLLLAMARASLDAAGKSGIRSFHDRVADGYRAIVADPAVARDPRLRAIANLSLAQAAGNARQREVERQALLAVAGDPALGEHDQLKVAALVMLANVEANAGNLDAARAAYDKTGLTAEQCALIDGGPILEKHGASSADFPRAAMRWRFEGWTQLEYDIGADGRTTNIRTVMAYPPAVFSDAAEGMIEDAVYRASYRPGNDLGCGGASQRVVFSLPG